MIDHRSYAHNLSSCEIKAAWKKNSGLKGIRNHDLCDTSAVLYQLSHQAIWEFSTLWVRNVPVQAEEYKWIYEIHIFELRRVIWRYDWLS